MRIRSIKPDFWRSKTIADLSWDARLVLKGLESYVDDNGVGKYDLELIISDVFSRDHFRNPRETVERVSEAIYELVRAGLVVRYAVAGEELLYIDKWKDIQRVDKPNSGRYRRPDGTLEYSEAVNRDSYRKPRETVAKDPAILAPVTGEQGNRGTGEQGELKDLLDPDGSSETDPLAHITEADFPETFTPIYSNAFEEWWEHYPRKAGKRKAFNAWKSARKRASNEDLIDGARRYADDPNRTDQYTKYPEGWLNADGWLDEPLPVRTDGPRYRNGQPLQGADLRAAENANIASLFSTQKAIDQ